MSHHSILSRRHFVTAGLTVTTALSLRRHALALGFSPEMEVCQLTPEQEVGPYYVADELLRSNIVEGKPGLPLSLRIVLLDSRTCQPLPNAAVDIWHCDALGLYSGFTKQNPMGPGGPPQDRGFGGPPPGFDPQHPKNRPGPPEGRMGLPPVNHPTDHLTFLRGIQLSGKNGAVDFHTIFLGVYMGRTNHIHFKVRIGGQVAGKTYGEGHTSHTGQVFFPEELAAQLMEHEPYSKHKIHRTTQAEDMVYNGQHGEVCVAHIAPSNPKDSAAGFHAEFIAAVNPEAIPGPAQRRGGPGFPPDGSPPNR